MNVTVVWNFGYNIIILISLNTYNLILQVRNGVLAKEHRARRIYDAMQYLEY